MCLIIVILYKIQFNTFTPSHRIIFSCIYSLYTLLFRFTPLPRECAMSAHAELE